VRRRLQIILLRASTDVVDELGKDIMEDIAKDTKVEATSTKAKVTQNEMKVNAEKGTVVRPRLSLLFKRRRSSLLDL